MFEISLAMDLLQELIEQGANVNIQVVIKNRLSPRVVNLSEYRGS